MDSVPYARSRSRRSVATILAAMVMAAMAGSAAVWATDASPEGLSVNGGGPGLDRVHGQEALRWARNMPRMQAILVARNGEIELEYVVEGPPPHVPVNIKSLSKTVLSALVGAAIDRGLIDGVDQPIVDLLGDRVGPGADSRIGEITIGHLLSMQSGLAPTSGPYYGNWVASNDWVSYVLSQPFVDVPGGRMLYSTGSSHLLSALLTRATGRSTLELARAWLGDPLNITVPDWLQDPEGIHFGGNEMHLSPYALLRIGELYRQGGAIDGKRVLSEAWIEASWTPRGRSPFTGDLYGYGWFITELRGHRVYYGRGFGGQMLYVIPDLAMTIVITSDPNPPSPGTMHLTRLNLLLELSVIPAAEATPLVEEVVPEHERAGQHTCGSEQGGEGERQCERDQQPIALHDGDADAGD
jgi:CubicO group peptidase (beta-lactamase class C family)